MDETTSAAGLKAVLSRWLRPGIGFNRPADVLKDDDLSPSDKRQILSSWASNASAVPDRPHMRRLLGTPEPVPLAEIQSALERLDWCEAWLPAAIDDPPPRLRSERRAGASRSVSRPR